MDKTTITHLNKSCKFIENHLDIIHNMGNKLNNVDEENINKLLEELESWRICVDEIELSIKKNINTKNSNLNTINKEIVIY